MSLLLQSKITTLLNEVLGQIGKTRKGGDQVTYHCPFCPDKNLITQKLEISLSGKTIGYYHCWRCNSKGRTFGSLLKKLNASQYHRTELFNITQDIRLLKRENIKELKKEICLPEEFWPIYKYKNTPEYRNAIHYLKKRNITKEDIVRYNIGYCESGPYENRIIIPSYDREENLNFFVGRLYYEIPGAITYKKPDISMNVVGFESFINYKEPINLCEGPFDAISIRNNAIPLFGKYLQPKLKESFIKNNVQRVNLILDNDAKDESIKNYEILKKINIDANVILLPEKDPSTMGFEKIHNVIKSSTMFNFESLLRYKLKI